jgi:hypothetical protein
MEDIYNIRSIKELKTNTLWLVQKKWYKQEFELTDDAFVYGKIYNKGWKQSTILNTATGSFKICNSWSGKLSVKTLDEAVLGTTSQKFFDRRVNLTLNDGFKATYYNPSFWKSNYVWVDEFENEIMNIKFKAISCKKAEITFNKPAAQIPNFNILVLLAAKLYLLKMAAAAAM